MDRQKVDGNKKESKAVILPVCHICNQVPEGGIRGGIRLKKAFICTRCEQKIVVVKVGTPDYRMLMEKLKQVLK
ncbi:MAG: sigma factor G inhibitor Gin [Syntrophomonadaceae bacterium]|jgi:hypothetical protein